jgi:hypothetical protein
MSHLQDNLRISELLIKRSFWGPKIIIIYSYICFAGRRAVGSSGWSSVRV